MSDHIRNQVTWDHKQQSMRILHICGAGVLAGREKMSLQLMTKARAEGHEVFCLTSSWNNGDFVSRLEAEKIIFKKTWLGFVSVTLRWQPLICTADQICHLPKLWRDFGQVVKEWKPDIIHHTNFHHVFLLACGPTRFGVPNIFHVHEAYAPTKAGRLAFKVINSYVDRYIAVSEFVKHRLLELGVASDKIGVVLNGVPTPKVEAEGGMLWRHRYGWTEDDVVVGMAGQVGPWKGPEDFIKAIAIVQKSNPRVKAVIIGAGSKEYLHNLERLATDCLPNSVAFAGYCSDMDAAYAGLDILVIPSRCEESFSLSAAEGMSYGLPVIGSTRGAIPEVLGMEFKDWLLPAEDPSALAEKIRLLASDETLRTEIGEKLRQRAMRELTLERCSNQVIGEYKAAVAERGVVHCA